MTRAGLWTYTFFALRDKGRGSGATALSAKRNGDGTRP